MSNFWTILKMLFKSRFGFEKTSKAKRIFIIIGLLVLYVLLIAMVGYYIYLYVPVFVAGNAISQLILFILLSVAMITMIMGIVSMLVYVYLNRDSEFMSSLPVKSSTVFGAKMTIVLLSESVLSIAMLLPVLIMIGIFAKMSAVFFIVIPLIVIITPIMPFMFVALIAIPLMYLVSFFKKRGIVTTLFLIILFAGFFVLYMLAISGLNSGVDHENADISGLLSGITVMGYIFYPLQCLANLASLQSFAGLNVVASAFINLFIALGGTAAIGAVTLAISGAVYYKGVAAQLESSKKNSNKEASYKSSSNNVMTLFKREVKDITRNTSFGFQCLSGIILVPLIVLLFHFMPSFTSMEGSGGTPEEIEMANQIMQYTSLWVLMAMGVGMNSAITTAVSREGQTFIIFKTLPVTPREAATAKLILGYIISAATLIMSTILYGILNKMNFFDTALLLVFLLIYSYAFCCFGLWNDIRSPKLNWTSPNEVVKRSSKVYFPMLVNMAMTIPLMLIYIFLSMIPWLAWLVMFVIVIGLAVAFDYILRVQTDKYYEKIEI